MGRHPETLPRQAQPQSEHECCFTSTLIATRPENLDALFISAQSESEESCGCAIREAHKIAVHMIPGGRFDNFGDDACPVPKVSGPGDNHTIAHFELRLARLRSGWVQNHQAAGSDGIFFLIMSGSTDSVSMNFQMVGNFGWAGQSGNLAPSRMMISRPQHREP